MEHPFTIVHILHPSEMHILVYTCTIVLIYWFVNCPYHMVPHDMERDTDGRWL